MPVTIGRPGQDAVDASSVLLLMTLGVGHGEDVEVTVDGDDAVLDSIVDLVATDLDAEDAS